MHAFRLEGMSCGHCVSAVTKAVHSVDPDARVSADPATGKVEIESHVRRDRLAAVIGMAGYRAIEHDVPKAKAY